MKNKKEFWKWIEVGHRIETMTWGMGGDASFSITHQRGRHSQFLTFCHFMPILQLLFIFSPCHGTTCKLFYYLLRREKIFFFFLKSMSQKECWEFPSTKKNGSLLSRKKGKKWGIPIPCFHDLSRWYRIPFYAIFCNYICTKI